MRFVTLPVLILAGAGCAGVQEMGRANDLHDRVYLAVRLRDEGCTAALRTRCCPVLKDRLNQALASEQMASVATALDALAIACPDMRDDALAALDHRSVRASSPDAGAVTVGFGAQIGPADRLYWASAFVDGKQLAGTPLSPGPHVLDVEVHVMSATGADSDALFRIHARKELVLEPKGTRSFLASLRRNDGGADGPFSLELVETSAAAAGEKTAPAPGAAPAGQPASFTPAATAATGEGAASVKTAARMKSFPKPRFPSELRRDHSWGTRLRVCVSPEGRVQSMTPMIDPPHPRLLGMLLNSLAHTEYSPYRVDGQARPFCYPLQITVSPG
jgi:hypothetical protein